VGANENNCQTPIGILLALSRNSRVIHFLDRFLFSFFFSSYFFLPSFPFGSVALDGHATCSPPPTPDIYNNKTHRYILDTAIDGATVYNERANRAINRRAPK
jgi:hypothetical protein